MSLKVGPTAAISDLQHETRDFGETCPYKLL